VVAVEAMKMENALASPIDGVVSEVRVAVDDTVEAATVLVVVSADDTEPATP
jgi:biotin carboxyl carrier protein